MCNPLSQEELARQLVQLFDAIDELADADEVVEISAKHAVEFLRLEAND